MLDWFACVVVSLLLVAGCLFLVMFSFGILVATMLVVGCLLAFVFRLR